MRKNTKKKLLGNAVIQTIICRLAWLYCMVVYLSSLVSFRVKKNIAVGAEPYFRGEKNAVFALWHGRLLMMGFLIPKKRKMYTIISKHGDGRLISRVIGYFGADTIFGSTSKGATSALREMIRKVKEGNNISITPDGPRGPYRKAALGVVAVPSRTNVPIIPVAVSASWSISLKSWDKFMIPLPFTKLVFVMGEPLFIDKAKGEEELQKATHLVEESINKATEYADRLANFDK